MQLTLYCYYYSINFSTYNSKYAITAAHEVSGAREPIGIVEKQ